MLKSFILRQKFWIKDAFKGSKIRKQYNNLKKFDKLGFNKAKKIQEQKLKSLLLYAQHNSKFYSKFESLNLEDYPVMNKTRFIENFDLIKVNKDLIPGQIGEVHVQTTSGSTGTPFKMPQDTEKRNIRIAELKYFGKVVGFKSHEPLIHLRTWNRWQSKSRKQIKNENIIPFDISKMGDEELNNLYQLIRNNKSVCIRGYASSLDLIAKYFKKKNLSCPSLKICIAGSETLHDDVRDNVKSALRCEIISQYANEECGILAQEKIPTKPSDNVMYFNNGNYIFECLSMDEDKPVPYGNLGRLVVTDLTNKAFPIIRYDTGDVVIFGAPNEFSNGFPVLAKLFGRRFDICYTTNNKPFSPMTIGRILKHYDKIQQWQFIQKGQKDYMLKIIFADNQNEDYLKDAINVLKESIGKDANIKIEKVKEIPVLSSMKRKPVINEWKLS